MTAIPAPPSIFSPVRKQQAASRRRAAQAKPDAARYIMDDMVEDVLDRLSFLRHAPASALVLGDWTGSLAAALAGQGSKVDAVEQPDDEKPSAKGGYDLVASLGRFDTVNDLPGALLHLRSALADGGLMIASFTGAGALPRLRSAMLAADGERPAARFHPLVDVRAGGQLLQRTGFARPVVDTRSLKVRFGSMRSLVADLRSQALGSVLANRAPTLDRAALRKANEAFLSTADPDGRVTETFELLTLSGWRQ
jgi:hypothetical protein